MTLRRELRISRSLKDQCSRREEDEWPRKMGQLRLGFLSLGVIDILGQVILYSGECPVHCRMFCSITISLPSTLQISVAMPLLPF